MARQRRRVAVDLAGHARRRAAGAVLHAAHRRRPVPDAAGHVPFRPEKPQSDEGSKDDTKSLSAFQAFVISAAARVGTGNVSGVAGAIFIGGPGAVVWMWIMCLFTSAASFIESTLAQLWKVRADDTYKGGPAFYIHRGLGTGRGFGAFFALLFIFCFALAFTSLQANTITDAVSGAVACLRRSGGSAVAAVPRGHRARTLHRRHRGRRDAPGRERRPEHGPGHGGHLPADRTHRRRHELRRAAPRLRPDVRGRLQPAGGCGRRHRRRDRQRRAARGCSPTRRAWARCRTSQRLPR